MRLTATGWAWGLVAQMALAQARYDDAIWREFWGRLERGLEVQSLLKPAPATRPARVQPKLASPEPAPLTSSSLPRSRPELVRQLACQLGLDPALALALIEQESGFQHPVRGRAGELGAAQILPATAQRLGYDAQRLEQDFVYNVRAGLGILKSLLEETGDIVEALRAYNGGRGWRALSPEAQRAVQRYAAQVLARKARYAGMDSPPPAGPN